MRKKLRDYLTSLILKRKRNSLDKILLGTYGFIYPKRLENYRRSYSTLLSKRRVSLLAASDYVYDIFQQWHWGDYWLKYDLTRAIGQLGYLVVDEVYNPDIVIHLFGRKTELPPDAYKILWIHSHPIVVDKELLSKYNKIYCISSRFVKKIRKMGFECEVAPIATAKKPRMNTMKYDVVFIGNARGDGHRKIVDDVGNTSYNFKVWGVNYRDLPERYWMGPMDYIEAGDVYSSSLISLNDHHADMAAEDFLNPRILDILASGGFCISDPNPAIDEIFGDAVPQYQSPSHLRERIDFYIKHPDERLALMEKGRRIALSHTWDALARQLLQNFEPYRE